MSSSAIARTVALKPRVLRREKPQQRYEQCRSIERRGPVVLAKDAPVVGPIGAHIGVDFIGRLPPPQGVLLLATHLGQLGATVGRHPAQNF